MRRGDPGNSQQNDPAGLDSYFAVVGMLMENASLADLSEVGGPEH